MYKISQDNQRFMSKQININYFPDPNRVKNIIIIVQSLSRSKLVSDSSLLGEREMIDI